MIRRVPGYRPVVDSFLSAPERRPAPPGTPTAATLRAAFDVPRPDLTVGVEEELMLLDARTLELVPDCRRLLGAAHGDVRFSAELPASQLEIITPVCRSADEVREHLLDARADLRRLAAPDIRLAGAGTHPFAPSEGELTQGPRYTRIAAEYQWAARRGLAWGLHVHVAISGSDRALAVHDALRSYLPLLAALAGNAPFHEGTDTGLHSVRPKIAEGFPRQGVPPAWETWERYADFVAWGARDEAFAGDGRQLWWEVRLHPGFGTLEVRVCDQPGTAAESAGLAAVVQALCARLGESFERGTLPPPAPRERIEENRWRALRYGLDGTLLDLRTGRERSTREQVTELLLLLAPYAERFAGSRALAAVQPLLERTGAQRQREVAARSGPLGVVADLADRFDAELRAARAAF